MLKALFSSKARVKLLTLFLLHPDQEFFIRELTRKLDEQINSVRRELDNLKKIGLLKSKVKNRKKYYLVNTDFLIYRELRDIIIKSKRDYTSLIRKISKTGQVDLLILAGFYIDEESPVDLLVVGEVDKEKLENLLSKGTEKESHEVKFAHMTQKDFLYRLECKDRFIHDFISNEKVIVAINKIEDEIEKLKI